MNKDLKKLLITDEELKTEVKALGQKIVQKYQGKPVTLIGLLKGAYVFMSDIARELESMSDVEVEFMAVKSYINSKTNTKPSIVLDIKADIADRHVIIIEDIIDTGNTLKLVSEYLKYRGAASIEIAALLSKEANREVAVKVDYKLFELPNEFVVGYGLDYNEHYRHLKGIYALSDEAIEKYKV